MKLSSHYKRLGALSSYHKGKGNEGMGRKRFVTSDISIDKAVAWLASEDPMAALMWPWFITGFDDWGRMVGDPVEVKLSIFQAFPYTAEDINRVIKLLAKHKLVHYYQIDGKEYLAVDPDNWYKYQTYIKKERKEKQSSRIPEPIDAPWSKINQQQSVTIADNQRQTPENVPSLSPSPSPSIDNDDDDDNARACEAKMVRTLEAEFGRFPSPSEVQKMQSYIDEGMEEALICEAIRRAREQGSPKVAYVSGILNNWKTSGIKTLTAAQIADEEFKKSKGGNTGGKSRADPRKSDTDRNGKYAEFVS